MGGECTVGGGEEGVGTASAQQTYIALVVGKYPVNKASAWEVKEEVRKAHAAGAQGAEDLAVPTMRNNAQMSLMRAVKKKMPAECPELYYADIPVHDPKTGTDGHMVPFPFLLPHELLFMLMTGQILSTLCASPLTTGVYKMVRDFCKQHKLPMNKFLALGVFGDGVPCANKKSVECVSWNLLAAGSDSTRYLFTCIPKEFTCKCGCSG